MRKQYEKKRNTLIAVLKEEFGKDIEIYGENAGLHVVVRFKKPRFELDSRYGVTHNNIRIHSVEKHTIKKGRYGDCLVFGYGGLSQDQIVQGVRALNRFKSFGL